MSGSGEEQEDLFEKRVAEGRRRARRSQIRRTRQRKRKWKNAFTALCSVALLALVAVGIWFWRGDRESVGLPGELEWHQGGTLHRATVRAWRTASYRDRLATSADFVSLYMELSAWPPLRNNPERKEFREMAEAMEAMILATGNVDQSVEDAAAACWALLDPEWR